MSKQTTDKMNQTGQTAFLYCVTPPTAEQEKRFLSFLRDQKGWTEPSLKIRIDESLESGFILEVGDELYDWSSAGRSAQLREQLGQDLHGAENSFDRYISVLKENVQRFELAAVTMEAGHVLSVGDGIAWIDGMRHVMYGEIVVFEDGSKGMVLSIEEDQAGVILFGDDREISQGTRAVRSGKMAGISVGEDSLGRVLDALGSPLDGRKAPEAAAYYPVERPAPGIIDRVPVDTPLQTGILAIDAMFPIGRGQRELIIGDRQTGKTSIALDTILNQKGKDCLCIYVAIGQKASTVASLVNTLEKNDAMSYTTVICATAADPAPLQYLAPYAGCALAEYFMDKGRDVLIIYDDLSKHAVAYRALSLLLGRSPGREAYPGDVFYLHSRLLERSSHLSPELGGGSITALPVVETLDGDVSAYIPTNVISITDGQIFLENDLFFEGQRPAVNVGLSVSRVGGAAQTKAMKKATGSLRIDLAQYREMAVFTQFSSDLDEMTLNQLKQGKILMELLKQPLAHPLQMVDQVILLTAAVGRKMINVPPKKMREFKPELLKYIRENAPELVKRIETSQDLTERDRDQILSLAEQFAYAFEA